MVLRALEFYGKVANKILPHNDKSYAKKLDILKDMFYFIISVVLTLKLK